MDEKRAAAKGKSEEGGGMKSVRTAASAGTRPGGKGRKRGRRGQAGGGEAGEGCLHFLAGSGEEAVVDFEHEGAEGGAEMDALGVVLVFRGLP